MAERININSDTKMPSQKRHFYDNNRNNKFNNETQGSNYKSNDNRQNNRFNNKRQYNDESNGDRQNNRYNNRYGNKHQHYGFVENETNDNRQNNRFNNRQPTHIIIDEESTDNRHENIHNNRYDNRYPNRYSNKRQHYGFTDETNNNFIEDEYGDELSDLNSEYEDPYIKEQLLNFIYKKLDVSRYKYKLLEFEKDLDQLKNTKFISPNYNGINSLLVFTRLKDKFYSFTVDRRTLKYNIKQIDISTIKLIPVNVRLDESIYDGTVIDGVILYNNPNKDRRRKKIYVINDIYMFQGNICSAEIMTNKIMNMNAYLDHNYKKDDQFNNIEFIVNTFYELKDMGPLVNTNIPKSTYRNSIKGIAFFPERSGTKYIYLYSNCTNMKQDNNQEQLEIKENSPKEKIEVRKPKIIAPTESIEAVFRMKQTDVVDVFNLYLSTLIEKDNKKFVKYVKYGIAYIQTVESSYFCKDLFKSEGKDTVLVKCKYIPDKNKWVPFEHITDKKLPDNYDDVHKHFSSDI